MRYPDGLRRCVALARNSIACTAPCAIVVLAALKQTPPFLLAQVAGLGGGAAQPCRAALPPPAAPAHNQGVLPLLHECQQATRDSAALVCMPPPPALRLRGGCMCAATPARSF